MDKSESHPAAAEKHCMSNACVVAFFQSAEARLSASRGMPAQESLAILQQIKALIIDINPCSLPGRAIALEDTEDGSAGIEWIRERGRLGFIFDNENESSWFVVLPNGFSDSGYLNNDFTTAHLCALLESFLAD